MVAISAIEENGADGSNMSKEDYFICPACGAGVNTKAKACPECGSDDETGWSEAAEYDDLDLPEESSYDEFIEETFGRRRVIWRWIVLAVLLGFLFWLVILPVARFLGIY